LTNADPNKGDALSQIRDTDAGSDQFEIVADYACETGENPLWHEQQQRLYWTDIPRGRLFRYDPNSGEHEQCYEGRPVGGFTIQNDGSLLLFMDRGTVAIWNEGLLKEIIPELPAERTSRFNDVIADPRGRVFCGTMATPERKGRLYRVDPDGSCNLLLEGVDCSNGMAFTSDCKSFYHTDSFAHEIYVFDYDIATGSIHNQKVFARFTEADGMPDGLTMDADGGLWTALWGGSGIARLRSNGEVDRRIGLPTPKTSSLTFAGHDYSDLYVTTAGGNTRNEDGELAGALFRIRNQARGIPQFSSNVRTPNR
jgi:sugar lactone lactonase YvrE